MSDPVLSIVIVTFNAERFLGKTLESIAAQVCDRDLFEVLIIDGGSADRTLRIAGSSSVVGRIVSEPDHGIYDAMNKGASLASGDWLHFLNAGDAFVDSASLGRVVQSLKSASGRVWGICRAIHLGGGHGSALPIPSFPHNWMRHALGVQPHCHQATFVDRRVFNAVGGHSTHYGTAGDFDLILRLGLMAPPVLIDRVCISYLGGGVSAGAWHDSSRLQHRIRVERFGLGSGTTALDLIWTKASVVVSRARVAVGRLRLRRRAEH